MRADNHLDARVLWCEGHKVHPEIQVKGFTGCWVEVIYPLVNIKPFQGKKWIFFHCLGNGWLPRSVFMASTSLPCIYVYFRGAGVICETSSYRQKKLCFLCSTFRLILNSTNKGDRGLFSLSPL